MRSVRLAGKAAQAGQSVDDVGELQGREVQESMVESSAAEPWLEPGGATGDGAGFDEWVKSVRQTQLKATMPGCWCAICCCRYGL
jgi:hypothetical protein